MPRLSVAVFTHQSLRFQLDWSEAACDGLHALDDRLRSVMQLI